MDRRVPPAVTVGPTAAASRPRLHCRSARRRLVERPCLIGALAAAALALPATAADDDALRARDDRIAQLERTLDVVVDELASLKEQVGVPETRGLEASHGLGPAASKVYGVGQGLSIGGYGEAYYRNFVHDQGRGSAKALDDSDFLRLVLYFGYKFSERIVFNSEIEFEHASTGEDGSVSVELASLDFFWKDWANARAGLLLVPMGFINEVHEPPFFYGVQRPLTERAILPSTWRENGVGLFGRIGEELEYRSYVMTGFDAAGFSASGIRGGRQKGSEALAEDLAWVGRLDWTPSDALLLGGSLYVGKSGQDQVLDGAKLPGARLTLGELHAQWRHRGFHTRALVAMSKLADADELSLILGETIAERSFGAYTEFAYDLYALLFGDGDATLEPFFRVEYVDTQLEVPSGFPADRSKATWLYTSGINYKPHPNVVLKAEYRNFQPRAGDIADELSVGMGFAF